MSLTQYKKKRNFRHTPEPGVAKQRASRKTHRFVVQRHDASHLHYDFRLELDGMLKSWAVPKGPSLNPADKRLAVMVEDHPVGYIGFHGTIPPGNYGAGEVEIWDKGTYYPVDEKGKKITDQEALQNLEQGNLKFELKGKKLNGGFALVHFKKENNNWLLIKHKDEAAVQQKYDSEKDRKPVVKSNKSATAKKSTVPAAARKKKVLVKPDKGNKYSHYHKPMLATLTSTAFDDSQWIYELKWDGYRAVAECGTRFRFYSRNGLSFIDKYPILATALQEFPYDAVLDGEIVVLDKQGRPNFQLLQHYEENKALPIVYYVFDLLALNGKDTTSLPLVDRKDLLEKILRGNELIRYCEHVTQQGKALFKQVIRKNMEGIIAKKANSTYQENTRSHDWLKIKHHNTREAVIAGYTAPRGSRKYFGALILGEYQDDQLVYIGHTGTGFNATLLKTLWDQMQQLRTAASPFTTDVKVNSPVTWLEPRLVCQVKYTEETKDGYLRHPVFLGLREDKAAGEVQQANEQPQKIQAMEDTLYKTVNRHKLEFSHVNKIYWPGEGFTKGDLIDYYEQVATTILPYLKDRPLSLKRNPNGIQDNGFFHKDAGDIAPDWFAKKKIHSESNDKEINYLVCNDKASLLFLANLGCIEINPWNSTTDQLDRPDYLVLDLDPSDKNDFDDVIEVALAFKALLDRIKVTGYCKTSGGTGLHIYIPCGAQYTYDQVKDFAHLLSTLVHEQLPETTTLTRPLAKRSDKKIYLDYLQNRRGQTLVAPYSLRPRPGAPVSTPLDWSEVKKGLNFHQFTIKTIQKRLDKDKDLFKKVLGKGFDLSRALQLLEK